MLKYPDYDNSILSVTSSVLKHYGVNSIHRTNNIIDEKLACNPRNVILLVLDGMGTEMMNHLPENSYFKKNMVETISSVFPSTTAAATTTLKTGLSPAEHGRIGMYLYFDAADDIVSVFKNQRLSDGKILDGIKMADRFTPIEKVFNRIEKSSPDVKAMEISQFSEFKCKSFNDVCQNTLAVSNCEGRYFLYCYWDQPDRDAHIYGSKSSTTKRDIDSLCRSTENLCRTIPDDTLVIVTSDHGHIDTKWIDIYDYPELSDMLERKPSVERRAVSFKVKDGMKELFEKEFKSLFGNKFMLLTFEEIMDRKLFGNGDLNPMCRKFVGDFMAVSSSDYSIALTPEDKMMKSCHAGLTDEEMNVPLIINK